MEQKITPFLWYDGKAEEAAKFYTSIFNNSKILSIMSGPNGSVTGVTFQREGQPFMALNCETRPEVDGWWEKLSEDGKQDRCGWLQDKYGLSWQIIPAALGKMLHDDDYGKAMNVMNAMLQMTKIDIAGPKRAYEQ
jgi:predicted 3-demethylubiquinone-9 3-methyltransferase (glyoxalase superfamily)